jgi:hypothetical protein
VIDVAVRFRLNVSTGARMYAPDLSLPRLLIFSTPLFFFLRNKTFPRVEAYEARLNPKTVQPFAGCGSLQVAIDRYGHLFKSDDHRTAMDQMASQILGNLASRGVPLRLSDSYVGTVFKFRQV